MVSTFIRRIKNFLVSPLDWLQRYIYSEQYIEGQVGLLVKILLLLMLAVILIIGMSLI